MRVPSVAPVFVRPNQVRTPEVNRANGAAHAPLVVRANQVRAPIMDNRVAAMVNQLRNNHECRHTQGWAYTRGSGRCEVCHSLLPLYLFRCRGCQLMACNRCRNNRL